MGGALLSSLALLRRERPAALVALGGWPCAPMAIGALAANVPLHLLATDAVPGAVVRALHGRAAFTYVACEEAKAALAHRERVVVVGRIVRAGVLGGRRDPARFGLRADRRTLYVVGGSLGAHGLNEAVVRGLLATVAADPGFASRLQVIHSTGPTDLSFVRDAYAGAGILAHVSPYVAEAGDAYATADLVACRGGAGTLAEVAALRLPAVVVPYPHHADRQQWRNAAPLASRGAVRVVEEAALDATAVRTQIVDLLFDDAARAAMRGAGADASGGAGAAAVADHLVRSMEEAAAGTGASRAGPLRERRRRPLAPVEART
jgi:UDP-N-acetylglucosamine--N-acetylmuramyl-(pentapeptide) pyrophosphoryl-undecaprenol N-acetylglucosamine transferase